MIRTIDIRLNAAHPELPLPEATTYQGAPSTAFLRGVPKACGQWHITAVNVAVTFPDNSTTTRAAVLSAGDVWVCTIPACATSGRVVSGLRILADGTDENGDAVTGFVLGVADFAVATFDIAPAPGVTSYALRYFDNVPNPAHKGDVAKIADVLKYYDGSAWQVFADVDLSNYATKADATLTPIYDPDPTKAKWICDPAQVEGYPAYSVAWTAVGPGASAWVLSGGDGSQIDPYTAGDPDAETVSFEIPSHGIIPGMPATVTATRVPVGYYLGSDQTKILTPKEVADALAASVAAKYAKPSGGIPKSDLASGVQTSLDKADVAAEQVAPAWVSGATYDTDALVSYNGIVYQNTSGVAFVSDIPPPGDTNWGARPVESSLASLRAGKADKADLPYSQSATTLDTARILLSARSANRYDLSAVTGEVAVTLPTVTSGKCADVVCTIVTGATVPTLSFPSGAVFIAADSAWQTLAASSYNVFSFTSTGAPNEWIVGRITSALPTA